MWPFGEENLYECMGETYIPLLDAIYELYQEEGIKARFTVGLTPILVEQMADPHLQQGFVDYMDARLKAAHEDVERYSDTKNTTPHREHKLFLAQWYIEHFNKMKSHFEIKYQRNLVGAFKKLQDEGCIEITTSGATHGFSPLLGTNESVNAQFKVGVEAYKKYFGKAPKGCWLPECAYRPSEATSGYAKAKKAPSTDAFLHENGLEYFFTEYHAIEGGASAQARRVFGIYGNIEYIPLTPRPATGLGTYEAYWLKHYPVAVFGRNNRASFQVWSAAHGYPGDGLYREFHKKDENSGMHYWRLTSKDTDLADKMLYDPVLAFQKTQEQADHFTNLVYHLLKDYNTATGRHGLVEISFDTELFGHWWFEGVEWLKHLARAIHKADSIAMETGSGYLAAHQPDTAIELPESSWGQGGHYWVWQNEHTEWMWPIIHSAEFKMKALVETYQNSNPDTLTERCLNQTLRELLLLESSDWPFLVTTFQAKDYAIERFEGHVSRFWALANMLSEGASIDEGYLSAVEAQDNPFENIDYRWFNYQPQPVERDNVTSSTPTL